MKKNYYDILEINKNASPEIVEKAYKTLVKMYHPDLQEENLKYKYEEKLKLINEAYEILSDEEKRKEYDKTLEINNISSEEFDELYNENIKLKNKLNNIDKAFSESNSANIPKSSINNKPSNSINYQNQQPNQNNLNNNNQAKYEDKYNRQVEAARNKAYHDAYIQDLKNRGYKIRYKKSFKDYVRGFVSIIIVIIVLILIWQIPFVQNYFIDLYNSNEMIHSVVDLFFKLFKK